MRATRRTVAHTVEDAEGLLNSLLLLTVLMLAFAVNQATAIFSLEDFLLADQRDARAWWNLQGRPENTGSPYGRGPVSHYFIMLGMHSILWLVIALVLGVISYISLCYSDARESPEFLKLWWKVHRWVMALAWLAFLGGTFCFLLTMHSALDIVSPRYDSFDLVNGIYREPDSQDLGFGITLWEAKKVNNGLIAVICLLIIFGTILHVVLVFVLHPDKKAPHETTEVDEKKEKATEVDELLAALRQVLLSSTAV